MKMTANEIMLQAQADVCHHAMAHIGSLSIKCALELEIFDIIHAHGHPMTIPHLLTKLPISPIKAPFLPRIIGLLAHMGYFNVQKVSSPLDPRKEVGEEEEETYSLTPMSEILIKDSPTSYRGWFLGWVSFHLTTTGHHMSEWLRSDKPGYIEEFVYGKSIWDMANESAEFNLLLNEMMAGDSRLVMKAVVELCKEAFEGIGTLVDVGGGIGTATRSIAQAFPNIKCSFYDLPHVIASAPESSLVTAVGGNMFEHIPKADAIFLKNVLHDWNAEDCVNILKKCKEAIPKGGKIIIIDMVVKDRKDSKEIQTQLSWDVGMMMGSYGNEREEHEWQKIFVESGFTRYKISPLGMSAFIEVFP